MNFRWAILIFALSLSEARGAGAQDCGVSGTLPDESIFVGYSREGESVLRSAALLQGGVLKQYDGRNLTLGLMVYEAMVDSPAATLIETVTPYLERVGPDHCEFPAQLAVPTSKEWRIWSTKPLKSLRQPTASQRAAFRSLRPDCVHQGDAPPGEVLCTYLELLAVSDVDADGDLEYWHSAPYRWDTGLTILERAGDARVEVVVAVCPGCVD